MHISHKMQQAATRPAAVVFGCGNILIGDDGFGPEVIQRLRRHPLPATVELVDAGTGIREYLLDYLLLPELRPGWLIVVDAGLLEDCEPGQVRICAPADLPGRKLHDFSLHQFPTVNLLAELKDQAGMEVTVVLACPAILPETVAPGLSPAMRSAADQACRRILALLAPLTATEASTT